MRPVVVPFNKLFKGRKPFSMYSVQVKPFLNFAIGLRMFISAQDVPDSALFKELLKAVLGFAVFIPFIGIKLYSMISYCLPYYLNAAIFVNDFLHKLYAVFLSRIVKLASRQYFSAGIVQYHTYIFAIARLMPVKMSG